ncbi:MAG TPA: MFS transporter [Rickettsiales bacterium]|nr:MFS transporter [Rickettsiales bacterium]
MHTASTLRIKLSLFLTYFVFAVLMNSVGTVILQVINNYGVSKTDASILEAFKDLTIASVSFLVASFLARFGFRRAMMVGLAMVTLATLAMPLIPSFWTTKLLFLSVGIAFALTKVSVYSTVGLITEDAREHAGFMNTIEGIFMIGVLSGYWLFSAFIDSTNPHSQSWLNVYWIIAAVCAFNIVALYVSPCDESNARVDGSKVSDDFRGMLRLMARPMVYMFVISIFLYVLIEQSICTWLPTFNNQILKLPSAMSVQMTSIFAACLALGRLGAGVVMRRMHWHPVLTACLLAMGVLVLLTLPLTHGITENPALTWWTAPPAAYIFPLIGLFMAPIYPALSSVMLSALPKHQHSAMCGLIVIFSALGGTIGSRITGYTFDHFSGQTAFYLSLIPMGIIMISLFFFKRETDKIIGTEQLDEERKENANSLAAA